MNSDFQVKAEEPAPRAAGRRAVAARRRPRRAPPRVAREVDRLRSSAHASRTAHVRGQLGESRRYNELLAVFLARSLPPPSPPLPVPEKDDTRVAVI